MAHNPAFGAPPTLPRKLRLWIYLVEDKVYVFAASLESRNVAATSSEPVTDCGLSVTDKTWRELWSHVTQSCLIYCNLIKFVDKNDWWWRGNCGSLRSTASSRLCLVTYTPNNLKKRKHPVYVCVDRTLPIRDRAKYSLWRPANDVLFYLQNVYYIVRCVIVKWFTYWPAAKKSATCLQPAQKCWNLGRRTCFEHW